MYPNKRQVAVLGSTGSIGTQTLDIIRDNGEAFAVHTLTAGRNYRLLIEQALEFRPRYAIIAAEEYYADVAFALRDTGISVLAGADAIEEVVTAPEIDVVITAMVGYAGLWPTIAAVRSGKVIGLANKETLVVAGQLIMSLVHEYGARIIPVDSEHSAIFQCLVGEKDRPEKIILTASGGPFRKHTVEALRRVTVAEALKHPNWSMGAKVSIDSASLMNKGLEMIEAKWLFGCSPDEVEVLVHPQSIIHSMVQFADGSVKAQLGAPDMRLPISYALGVTERVANDYPRYDFLSQGLTFERPDTERFPNLSLAYEAIRLGGNAPCALNAANEIAVESFIAGQISFLDMSKLIERALGHYNHIDDPTLEALEATDSTVRALSREYAANLSSK